jgi:energy-coupling factor transporter ATP-binding protein EcfA2
MRPLTLTLKGFRGIRDGLGLDALTLDFEKLAGDAQLVALVGANGRGKSTIMENMTPFLTMPSRATVAGPGGFSYYDHVFLPENTKDLIWVHEGAATGRKSSSVSTVDAERKPFSISSTSAAFGSPCDSTTALCLTAKSTRTAAAWSRSAVVLRRSSHPCSRPKASGR